MDQFQPTAHGKPENPQDCHPPQVLSYNPSGEVLGIAPFAKNSVKEIQTRDKDKGIALIEQGFAQAK
ncbi:MAG: hypothetical protein M3Q97_10065, partial [Bacteroidota bacterium]|nr:hypothetical protein [Bacteroidota bacterium]